jgi:hypothetical protein
VTDADAVAIPRAVYWAARVPGAPAPFDTLHLKIFYPARPTGSNAERMSGAIPADASRGPLPVVVLCPGVNVNPDGYRWLAATLCERGFAVVVFTWVGEIMPGFHGIMPGVDLNAFTPETYGTKPAVPCLPPILGALAELDGDERSPLKGMLALANVAVGGHSAGGIAAFQATDHRYYPRVAAAFTYGSHNVLSTMMGFAANHVGRVPADCPLLLLGGTEDGVIAQSAARYGNAEGHAVDPIARTFDEAIDGGRGDAYLVILEGANHLTITHPHDPTSARGFLDKPEREPDEARAIMARLIGLFLDAHLRGDEGKKRELAALIEEKPARAVTAKRK